MSDGSGVDEEGRSVVGRHVMIRVKKEQVCEDGTMSGADGASYSRVDGSASDPDEVCSK